jgi:2-haloacid dehalogenase
MVIVFDLNGTLLDIRAVQPELRSIFGRQLTAEQFFTRILQYSMALSMSGGYSPFSDIALAVLKMEADARKIKLTEAGTKRVAAALRSLPAFPEVPGSLRKLRKAGFRLAVLTNSAYEDARVQVANAKLSGYFDHVFSSAEVRRFKPAPEVYDFAAKRLGVQPHQILIVAAHPWDLMGAAAAGCRTAFIQRPGKALFPGIPKPTYMARDMAELAAQLKSAGTQRPSRVIPAIATAGALSALALAAAAMRCRSEMDTETGRTNAARISASA